METSSVIESFTSVKLSKKDKDVVKRLILVTGILLFVVILLYLIIATYIAYNKWVAVKTE